jgi:hypothetical protein
MYTVFTQYECPNCGKNTAYNGDVDKGIYFRGSAKCRNCGEEFSAVHSTPIQKSVPRDQILGLFSWEQLINFAIIENDMGHKMKFFTNPTKAQLKDASSVLYKTHPKNPNFRLLSHHKSKKVFVWPEHGPTHEEFENQMGLTGRSDKAYLFNKSEHTGYPDTSKIKDNHLLLSDDARNMMDRSISNKFYDHPWVESLGLDKDDQFPLD